MAILLLREAARSHGVGECEKGTGCAATLTKALVEQLILVIEHRLFHGVMPPCFVPAVKVSADPAKV
jgi:hypothetical protein